MEGWERYYHARGIRVETMAPARELTVKQARAPGVRMLPALAALATRARGTEEPVALALESACGKLIFLPPRLSAEQSVALAAFEAAMDL